MIHSELTARGSVSLLSSFFSETSTEHKKTNPQQSYTVKHAKVQPQTTPEHRCSAVLLLSFVAEAAPKRDSGERII